VLSGQFVGWSVQNSGALSSTARDRWQAAKPPRCPGIAIGQFANPKNAAFAVLLVGSGQSKGEAMLLVCARDDVGYHENVLERFSSGASNYFVRSAQVRQFFDAAAVRKFGVASTDSIVLFDAGKDDYGVEVYFWTGDGFRHEPVDY
jgi:hypothetical protein